MKRPDCQRKLGLYLVAAGICLIYSGYDTKAPLASLAGWLLKEGN